MTDRLDMLDAFDVQDDGCVPVACFLSDGRVEIDGETLNGAHWAVWSRAWWQERAEV